MITYDREKVLNAYLNGKDIIDGHSPSGEIINKDTSLVILRGKDRPLCLFIKGNIYCSLNGVGYKPDTGYLYLSQSSEGGAITGSTLTEKNVAEYNDSVMYDSIKIIEWIDRDGAIHSIEDV